MLRFGRGWVVSEAGQGGAASRVRIQVALETPRHAALGGLLDYESERPHPPGTMVRVPLGKREVPGLVWDGRTSSGEYVPYGVYVLRVIATYNQAGGTRTIRSNHSLAVIR